MKRPPQQTDLESGSADARREQAFRVLVVDDDAATAKAYGRLLEISGFEGHVCVHGVEAMEMIERLRPQAVVLDLSMPGVDGFGIAEELQHNPDLRPTLLIAHTAHDDDAYRTKTTEAGFDYHLVKPIHWDELRAILHDCETKWSASLGRDARRPNNPR